MGKLLNKTQNNFTQISNILVNDTRISLKAKGLYLYLASKPDNWDFYIAEIASKNSDGVEAVKSGLKELEKNGYLIRHQRRKADGQFTYDYEIFVEPLSEPVDFIEHNKIKTQLTINGKPMGGKAINGNMADINNTNNSNTNISNTDINQDSISNLSVDIAIDTDIETNEYLRQLEAWWDNALYRDEVGIEKNRILDALYPSGYSDRTHDKVFEKLKSIGNGIFGGKQKVRHPFQYLRKCLKRD